MTEFDLKHRSLLCRIRVKKRRRGVISCFSAFAQRLRRRGRAHSDGRIDIPNANGTICTATRQEVSRDTREVEGPNVLCVSSQCRHSLPRCHVPDHNPPILSCRREFLSVWRERYSCDTSRVTGEQADTLSCLHIPQSHCLV